MIEIPPSQWSTLAELMPKERACSLVHAHVIATGRGRVFVDPAGRPRALAAFTGGNLAFAGEADAVPAGAFWNLLSELLEDWDRVFMSGGADFGARLRGEVPGLHGWPRVVLALPANVTPPPAAPGRPASLRRLSAADSAPLAALGPDVVWISDSHGGPAGLAASGLAWGAFADDRLVSVAASFFVGRRFEELGVVTEHDHRGRGQSPACAAALIDDIRGRGRTACWGTTPDNEASLRVARKLDFRQDREEMHWLAGTPLRGSVPLD
jgi:GNAT superfamily N-acetyltransferase